MGVSSLTDTELLISKMHSQQRIPLDHCDVCGERDAKIMWSSTLGSLPVGTLMCRKCGTMRNRETLPFELLEKVGKHGGSLVNGLRMDDSLCMDYFRKQTGRYTVIADFLESRTGSLEGKAVLDMICEVGAGVKVMNERGADCEGIDLSSEQGKWGREKMGLAIHDSHIIDFEPARKFDLVIGIRFINHFSSPGQVLNKIHGMLNRDGYMFLETLNFRHAIRRKDVNKCIKIDHPYMYTDSTLPLLLEKNGFEIVFHDNDLERASGEDFGSLNHMHTLARRVDRNESATLSVPEGMYRECLDDLMISITQYSSVRHWEMEHYQHAAEGPVNIVRGIAGAALRNIRRFAGWIFRKKD